jgi:sugar diacid utilization regulator
VKSGSNTNEMLKTAKETIKELTQKHVMVLCYGTNGLNQRNIKKSNLNTLQNLKEFIVSNNHTDILVINIPVRYDTMNNDPVNKIISRINVKLQKKNSAALVRKRTIPTERPPPVGEVTANFCG